MNLDLNFLLDLQKIRIERKTTEELLEKLFREQTPSDYPTTTLQGEKVQSNHMTKTAETVVLQIQQLMFYLEVQRDNLIKTEIEAIKKINIEVKDSLLRSFLVKKFILNKPTKEIIRDFGWSKPTFYKKFQKYFRTETNLTKIDEINSSNVI